MICLISPTYYKAEKFAISQGLASSEWFYYTDDADVMNRTNFHTLVVGEFEDHKLPWFEKAWRLAKMRGAINRL